MSELPQIFAFYSFKGGVGRSMALLNLAYALVAKGRNVLVLDMDLEAPGLSGFMSRQKEIAGFARHDMVDLLLWAKQTAQRVSENDPLNPVSLPPLSDYAVRVRSEKLEGLPQKSWDLGRLDVIPIDLDRDYYDRLSEVAVAGMDRDTLLRVGSLLRSWLKSRRIPLEVPDYYGPVPDEDRSAPYDFVLIDSRTGITEVGGLCIGPLSDQLVVLCGLNDQNVEGTRQFLTEVGVLKPLSDAAVPLGKPTLFVASPLPIGEMTTKSERLSRLSERLGPFKPKLFKLSYHPQMALMETIFVRDHPDELLAQEYRFILAQLLERTENASDFDPTIFFGPLSSRKPLTEQTRKSVRELLRSASFNESARMLFFALVANRDVENVSDDLDFQLMDRICRAVVSGEPSMRLGALGRWSEVLICWGQSSTDAALAARRIEEAFNRIDTLLENPKASANGRARALFNRGALLGKQGHHDREVADYTAVIEMVDAPDEPKAAALINRGLALVEQGSLERAVGDYSTAIEMVAVPTELKAKALFNRGIAFGHQGDQDRKVADYTAVIEMPHAPVELKADALIDRGITFRQQENPERAILDYTTVIEMFNVPAERMARALNNRGWAYFVAGRFKDAIADLLQAVTLNPKNVNAHGNLAISLLVDRQTNNALAAYESAIELADTDGLADLGKDLREAIAKHGALPGADEVRTRIESRAATLKTTAAPQ